MDRKIVEMIENLELLGTLCYFGQKFKAREPVKSMIFDLKYNGAQELSQKCRMMLRDLAPKNAKQHDAKAKLLYPTLY